MTLAQAVATLSLNVASQQQALALPTMISLEYRSEADSEYQRPVALVRSRKALVKQPDSGTAGALGTNICLFLRRLIRWFQAIFFRSFSERCGTHGSVPLHRRARMA